MLVNYNGRFFPENALPIAAGDAALRYGLSLFETMRWTGEKTPLLEGHFHRLQAGLKLFQTPQPAFFTADFLHTEIQKTVNQNNLLGPARIRLQVVPQQHNGQNGFFSGISYQIECTPCEPLVFNGLGIKTGFSENDFRSIPFPLCAFKTGNYASYHLAFLEARKRGLDDIFLLNAQGRIGESSTANVFWTESNRLFTPPLSEGIVAGVARNHLLQVLSQTGFVVEEQPFTRKRLLQADSLFLTNAFRGLRWVASCEGKAFEKGNSEAFFKKAFSVLM